MSFQAMAWATEQKLPTRDKFILLMLANYASNEKWDCHPSINTLASDTGMSRDTVMRGIKSLEDAGYLEIVRRMMDGINLPNVYRLIRAGGSGLKQGVVAQSDGGSSTERQGVVAQSDSNQSLEPINEPALVAADAATGVEGESETKKPSTRIPYQQIADLYNRVCGEVLPQCLKLNAKRKDAIRKVWNMEILGEYLFRDLDSWEGYFNDCLTSRHWTGHNDRNWRADIDFLLRETSVLKVLEAMA